MQLRFQQAGGCVFVVLFAIPDGKSGASHERRGPALRIVPLHPAVCGDFHWSSITISIFGPVAERIFRYFAPPDHFSPGDCLPPLSLVIARQSEDAFGYAHYKSSGGPQTACELNFQAADQDGSESLAIDGHGFHIGPEFCEKGYFTIKITRTYQGSGEWVRQLTLDEIGPALSEILYIENFEGSSIEFDPQSKLRPEGLQTGAVMVGWGVWSSLEGLLLHEGQNVLETPP